MLLRLPMRIWCTSRRITVQGQTLEFIADHNVADDDGGGSI